MAELEPLDPAEAKEMYLAQRRNELAEETLQSHDYRLRPFVDWCEENDITNLNDLSARDLHRYKTYRSDEVVVTTLKTQLITIRLFIRFCEGIDGVEEGVHEKMIIPTPSPEEETRDRVLDHETAIEIMNHQKKFEYASKKHALLTVLWHTSCRIGGAHSLDVCDFDPEEGSIAFRHRPKNGTRLKNGNQGERLVSLSKKVCEIIEDYIAVNRHDVTDESGREPLFTTRGGRLHKSKIRDTIYAATRPCIYGKECPHGRDPDSCEATKHRHASKCPSSVSPHDIRRGSLTHLLRDEVPQQVVSERANVSGDVLDKHYNQMTEKEKMEQRRGYLNNI